MDEVYVRSIKLNQLRSMIQDRVFAIPELQREFVWNANKVRDLLDSIHRCYPIGTILVWRTHKRNEGQLRKKFHILPPYDPTNKEILFLIDGQQRLSVIWHLLSGEGKTVQNADRKEIDFSKFYFDPTVVDGTSPFSYRARLRGMGSERLVPVVGLLSRSWRTYLRGHGTRARRRMETFRTSFLRYRSFLVFCESADLTEVRETFIRINSQGMRVGAADAAFARASRFEMRDMVREIQTQLKHGFGAIQRTTVLQAIALALGHRELGERGINKMIEALEHDEGERTRFKRCWRHLKEAFFAAADYFFYDLKVPNFDFLPSEPMFIILTLFFYYHGPQRPSRAVKGRVKQWFWATAVGARYTGRGYRTNLVGDARFVEKLANTPKAHASLEVRVPIYTFYRTEYSRPGPFSNAFFCLLRQNQPRYLEDGSVIPDGEISSRRNRHDKHHIFPRGLLSRHGIGPDKYNSILNICYLVARENQSVGKKRPAAYLREVPRSKRIGKIAIKSHYIPLHEGRGILNASVKKGFKTFAEDRAWMLVRALEKHAGMRLFDRS